MRPLSLALLLVSWVGRAADFVELDASVRGELQGRAYTGQVGGSGAGLLQLQPQVAALVQEAPATLTLSYGPQLLLQTQSTAPAVATQVLHRARLLGEYRFTPDRRLVVQEQASYGKIDFFSAAAAPGPSAPAGGTAVPAPQLQPIPTQVSLPFAESSSDVIVAAALDRRTRVDLDLSYLSSGGVGAGRSILPLQHRAQGTGTVSAKVTRIDTLASALFASRATFSEGQSDVLAGFTETWRHQLSALSDVQVGLGVSLVRSQLSPTAPASELWLPGGNVGFHLPFRGDPRVWTLDVLANLGPFVDRLTGLAYDRAEANVGLVWNDTPERWVWTLRSRGAVAVFGGQQHGESIFSEELSGAYLFQRNLKVEAGTRLLRQREPRLSAQAYLESLTYVSITWTERSIL